MSKNNVSFSWAFKEFIWPRRKIVSLGLFLIIVRSLSGLVLPYASKNLIDEVIPSKDTHALTVLLIIVCSALLFQSISSFSLTRILSVEAQHLISILRAEVQKKILKLPVSFFDNNKSGALVSRVMTDVEGVRNLVGTGLVQLIGGSITAVISLVILIKINAQMTLFVLVPVIIFAIIALKAFGYIRPIFRARGKINAEVTGRLTETLNGIRVIKGFNAEEQEQQVFEKGVNELFQNVKKSLTATALMTSSSTFLLGLASAGIMGMGGYFIMEGTMTYGEFVSFTLFLGFMIAPIVQMSNIGSQLTEAFAGLDRTQELMRIEEENNTEERTQKLDQINGSVSFKDITFSYDGAVDVLHKVSFEAPCGSVTALVGSSGSGKTTIAGLATAFLNPTSGQVLVDGVDLSKVDLKSFRSQLGVVLQDDFLYEGTIRENILFPRPDASEEELLEAVQGAYVNEFTDRFDNGLDTLIGERGVKLSGGQRQRISIARALLAKPKIVILDEATSNLDTQSEAFIQKSLGELMKNRTTFVIAHRLSTIQKADQILVIEEGDVVERGRHEELIASKGRYYELYTYQTRM
ncbi:ABC transporter ATP-binding protein/permease [Flavobacteriaceae bacterium]|uniref:ABC transporter ATP-binding protein n=1 Tax=Candidatus Arcticimaribacter forsetii TaxID=2820661 RepID=UPI002076EB8B|nr:ABC transporter ATP-binding protein [Candidatus Arcticimaribacter forsetii]MDA8639858.1 ABC transporter ATP-binding protein/permease [Flavobacteriaceae bacterium]MDA8698506.1 ABC transporter ATP-binding protein/permease [Flavobacteriaceae bacterium]MDB2329930.1 ABC transporter ATP-binding protein/permease [Flavobacteriaceae bacterium]MDB2345917.1 ABC transporter ATP-binding protein/permease [Flavobacteriaceae bacterium]MDB4621151.1 ABC transporter ATP-binding protein/permease [Flavobacteria